MSDVLTFVKKEHDFQENENIALRFLAKKE